VEEQGAGLLLCLLCAILFVLPGCKTPSLEPGGVYAPTNSTGQVLYNDIGLALADSSYQFVYESILTVMKFERNNRKEIWALTPEVKHGLDKLRPQVVDVSRRWAAARQAYRANPTPAGLTALQTLLAEIDRLLAVAQSQIAPVYNTLANRP
jgi:hypothetical protein